MSRYISQKTVATVPILLFVSVCVFLMVHLIPGDPAAAMLGENATPEALAMLRHELGLDLPLHEQYARWVAGVLGGDLGRSIRSGQPVGTALAAAIGPTVQLTALALLAAVALGVPAGIVAAIRPGSVADVLLALAALIGVSMPTFWSGLLLIYLFSLGLGWLPPSGYVSPVQSPLDSLRFMILPMLTLGSTVAAVVMRQTRASMLEVLGNDYIRTAHSKGLRERVVVTRHALRNALIPVITIVGLTGGLLLGGAVVTETIFAIPGMGRLIVTAIFERDFPTVQGGVLVIAVLVVFMNLLVDVLYAAVDPRVRY
ncbi:MAG: ABC transporter permease [Chloroflexota bacterium]|nr:ABC transporter permease [Chloroflexota bacterium]